MKKGITVKKLLKLSAPILIVAALLSLMGMAVYSATYGQNKSVSKQSASEQSTSNQGMSDQNASDQSTSEQVGAENQVTTPGQETGADTTSVHTLAEEGQSGIYLSGRVKDLTTSSDAEASEASVDDYTELLELLNVHEKYKDEMDRLQNNGHNLPDILTAYSFLNDRFGRLQEIETLVQEKESGKTWTAIFESYDKKNPEFVPGSFEAGYLEELMKVPGITADDIMLADRVSQKSGKTFEEVMEKRMAGETWKDINAGLDIVNGEEALLRITVSPEQIDKYVNAGMDREVVVQGYVIAGKLGQDAKTVMNELKAGTREEELLDRYYTQKYY